MEKLGEMNAPLAAFLEPRLSKCATYTYLERGVPRRGLKSSNASEQFNSAVVPERNLAICDLVSSTLNRMADYIFKRNKAATARFKESHLLVPRAQADHRIVLFEASTYKVWWDEETDDDMHATVGAFGGTLFSLSQSPHSLSQRHKSLSQRDMSLSQRNRSLSQ